MAAAIKRFQSINNFGSFQGYTWATELPVFTRVNILYGRNYSGKTTLSRILRCFETQSIPHRIENPAFSIEMSDGSTLTQGQLASGPCIRVFNQDFVRENLLFIVDPDAGLTPFAVLGADNAALQLQIDEIEQRLGSAEEAAGGLRTQFRTKESEAAGAQQAWQNLTDELDALLTDKATNRQTGIRYQSSRFGDQNYNKQKLQRELEAVQLATYQGIDETEINRLDALLVQLPLTNLPVFSSREPQLQKHIENAARLVSTPVMNADKIQELINSIPLNQWVHAGLEFHKGPGEPCKFCGEKISAGRWAELDRHFDEASQKLQAEIDRQITHIREEVSRLGTIAAPSADSFYPEFKTEIAAAEATLDEWKRGMQTALEAVIAQMELRRQQLHVPFEFIAPDTVFTSLSDATRQVNDVISRSNAYTAQLEADQSVAKEKLRLNEVLTFANHIGYATKLEKVAESFANKDRLSKEKNGLAQQIANLEQQIIDLRGQMSDQTAGAAATNSYLQHSFGHRELSLQFVDEPNGAARATRFEIWVLPVV